MMMMIVGGLYSVTALREMMIEGLGGGPGLNAGAYFLC